MYLLIAIAVLTDIAYLYVNSGHARLKENAVTAEPVIERTEAVTTEESVRWQDGWVKYKGNIYSYKDNIMTFLIMGIDNDMRDTYVSDNLSGGQADFLALFVLDPDSRRIEVIPINRNTMVNVEVYDNDGDKMIKVPAQIAVQHGVGNGREESCEYQVRAVTNLFYQLPIHGYAALGLEGIIPLNDAVGGVDVTVPENYVSDEITVSEGETIHLEGEDAYWFVRSRDDNPGGADRRLGRQSAYIRTLVDKVYNKIRTNPVSFMSLYNAVKENIVTNISSNELVYLATAASEYVYDEKSIHEVRGETVEGAVSDEFYVDDDALKELIINVFYEKVK